MLKASLEFFSLSLRREKAVMPTGDSAWLDCPMALRPSFVDPAMTASFFNSRRIHSQPALGVPFVGGNRKLGFAFPLRFR